MNLFANKPESIKDVQLGNPPSVYDAYLYRFTDLDTNRVYVGIHKGYVGDGYWHSSTHKDFNKLVADNDANLKYEILEYGDYNQMTVSEHKILTEADAKNNPLFFNKTNGSPKYRPIDLDKVKELANQIENGEFNCDEKESIEDISKLLRLQVRFQEDAEHVKDISEKIDDAGGSTDKCNPIVIYEKRQEGKDVIGDGNHTVAGVVKSKFGRDVPVARIPSDVHNDFTNEELIAVSNLLNKPADIIKKRASKEDMVKYIIKQYNNGVPVDDSSNKQFLKEMRFTNNQIKGILKASKQEVELNNLQKANQLWIDYSSGSGKKTLQNKVESHRDKDTMCIALSSAMFRWDHIFNHIFDNTIENSKTKVREQGKSKLVILVHHNGPAAEDKWKSDYQPDAIRKLKYYLHPLKYDFQIIEMPTTITNSLN
jgi:hypothetical protein